MHIPSSTVRQASMKSLHVGSANVSSDQCDTSEDWHVGMSPCQMSRFLQNEDAQFHHWIYLEITFSGKKMKWFWKQAAVVNMKLSLPLLVHLLNKLKQ